MSVLYWHPIRVRSDGILCEEQCQHFHSILNYLLENNFPYKVVTRHTTGKPWVTDSLSVAVKLVHYNLRTSVGIMADY